MKILLWDASSGDKRGDQGLKGFVKQRISLPRDRLKLSVCKNVKAFCLVLMSVQGN
jgi:hypothetical protein